MEIHDSDDPNDSQSSQPAMKRVAKAWKRTATKQIKTEDALFRDTSSALKSLVDNSNVSPTKATKEEDDDDIYSKYIATEMRMISDQRTKQYIKFKIQGLFYEAHCGSK